jgi:hypothetical protein
MDSEILCGVWGFSHTRFGGPGEKTPIAAESACDIAVQTCLHNPGGSIVGDLWGNTNVFSRSS